MCPMMCTLSPSRSACSSCCISHCNWSAGSVLLISSQLGGGGGEEGGREGRGMIKLIFFHSHSQGRAMLFIQALSVYRVTGPDKNMQRCKQ